MTAQSIEKIDESMNFESALAELETIVRSLDSGKASLDDSIKSYERGMALKNHCEKKLEQARLKIEKITITSDGKIQTEPFDSKE